MLTVKSEIKRCFFLLFVVMTNILICPVRTFAQFDSATLTGVVSDPTKAVISGAKIRVINEDTNVEVAASTNTEGRYTFANLHPGRYQVAASADGFTQAVSSHVIL